MTPLIVSYGLTGFQRLPNARDPDSHSSKRAFPEVRRDIRTLPGVTGWIKDGSQTSMDDHPGRPHGRKMEATKPDFWSRQVPFSCFATPSPLLPSFPFFGGQSGEI